MSRASAEVASTTIADVLAEFLTEQEQRLAPRTFRGYREVVELLQHNLNDYAYQTLDKAEAALFDRLYKAKGAEHREYCQIFGPERILPEIGYFMVRKVFAEQQGPLGEVRDEVEGYLRVMRIEGNALWLEDSLGASKVGPVALPRELCGRCKRGWTIAGVVGRVGNRWRLLEAWNVYAG